MKVALIVTGFLRSFNYENLKKYILDIYHPDVYIHLSSDERKEDRYLNKNISISDIIDLLKPMVLLSEVENKNMTNLSRMWYKIYQMSECISKNEKQYNMKYDIIIRYRPDTYLLEIPDLSLGNKNSIIIPEMTLIDKNKLENIEDPYICDIFAFGPNELMKKYCKMFEYLQETESPECMQNKDRRSTVPETALYYYLRDRKIPYVFTDLKYRMILSQCNIIGISGDSGAGKTKLCELLQPLFGGSDQVLKLECDRYHKWERGDENWQRITHLNPDANYLCKMREDCFHLKIGMDIHQVDYDHKNGKFTPHERISSKNTVLLCGLHAFFCDFSSDSFMGNSSNAVGVDMSFLDIKIFVDTDKNLQHLWKVQRDVLERGYKLENVLTQIKNRERDVSRYIDPQREEADIIIRYYTLDDINILSSKVIQQVRPNIRLQIIIKREINLYPFLNILRRHKLSHTYKYQTSQEDHFSASHYMDFENENFDAERIYESIMQLFNKKLPQVVKIESGFGGLIQNMVLFFAFSY